MQGEGGTLPPKVQNTPTRARARLGTRRGTRRKMRQSRDAHMSTRRPTQHVRRDGRRGDRRDGNVTVLKMIALPIAHVVALVCFTNVEMVCLKNQRDIARDVARVIALVCLALHNIHRCLEIAYAL